MDSLNPASGASLVAVIAAAASGINAASNDRLGRVEESDLRSRLRDPENVDLFEEGTFQSIRALSRERKEYMAELVARRITGEEKEQIESKRLLNLLR